MTDLLRPKVSIVLPSYNGASVIEQTLDSLFRQDFADFELIVSDDCSTDDTVSLVLAIGDPRIRCMRNETNLGYSGNLAVAARRARGDIIFLLGQDDILLPGGLRSTIEPFDRYKDVGVVTRPYYWFYEDYQVAVREVPPFDPGADVVFSLLDGPDIVKAAFSSFGQLSGLAIRRSLIEVEFHSHVFTAHIYPVADVLRRAQGVFLHNYTIAVRIGSSQTRHRPEIYRPPPLVTWVEMANSVYGDETFSQVNADLIRFLGRSNFLDLIQIRNYGTWGILIQEIMVFLRLRPANAVDFRFIFVVICCLVFPRRLLRKLVDIYKKHVLRHFVVREPVLK